MSESTSDMTDEVLLVDERFAIVAADRRSAEPPCVLKHKDTFGVFDRHGDIAGVEQQGLLPSRHEIPVEARAAPRTASATSAQFDYQRRQRRVHGGSVEPGHLS